MQNSHPSIYQKSCWAWAISLCLNPKTKIMKTLFTTTVLILFIALAPTKAIAQPANDLIENAIDLAYVPIVYNGTNIGFSSATTTNDDTPPSGCGVTQAGVWYRFTAAQNGTVFAGIVTPDDAVIIFYEGPATGVTSGMQLIYVDQQNNPCAGSGPLANIQATAGTTYYVYMRNVVDSDVIINAEDVFIVPANDLIENAIDLAQETTPYSQDDIHMLMATDTNDDGQIGCPSNSTAGIWYKITPSQEGEISALISGELGTTVGIFYSSENSNATSGEELTWVDQPNNPCFPNGEVLIQAEEGLTYYLFVASLNAYINLQIDVSSVLSTVDNQFIDVHFYPNPVTNELNLSAKLPIDEVVVYSLVGQKVFSEKIGMASSSIDLGQLSRGMYLMKVFSEGKSASYKIVKE